MAVNDLTSNVDSTYADDPSDSSVQVHQADHDEIHGWLKTAGDISSNVLTTDSVLDDLSDVVETTITTGDLLRWNGTNWVNYADSNFASSGHSHSTGDITSGTFVNARISQASVTQHEAALTITESQISDLDHYVTSDFNTDFAASTIQSLNNVTITSVTNDEVLAWNGSAWVNQTAAEAGLATDSHNHATGDVTSGTFVDARIAQSNVTQHQAALSITESQISDLDHLTIEEVQDNLGTAFLVQGTDISLSYNDTSNTLTISSTATGVTDHGALTGLGDDDHSQYLNSARHDSEDHSTAMGTVVLDDISDVVETTITSGDVLRWNGTNWVNYADSNFAPAGEGVTGGDSHDHAGGDGAQIDHGGLAGTGDDDHTQYLNSTRHDSEDHSTAMSTVVLDDISDVTETTITSGDLLRWNGTAWVNYADSNFASSGHGHTSGDISDFAEATSDQVGTMVTSNTETGITVTYQDGDNTLDFAVAYGGTPPALTPDIAAAAGVANTASRSDHVHNVPAAAAVGISNSSTNAEGDSTSFSRANHTHAVTGFALTSHNHSAANITSGTLAVARGGTGIASYTIGNYIYASAATTLAQRTPAQVLSDIGASATGHTHVEANITDLDHYTTTDFNTDFGASNIQGLSNVTITSVANDEVLAWNGSAWINQTAAEAGLASDTHTHATGDVTSGTFVDARIAQSNVTQHQAALSITESQISDLDHLTIEEVQDNLGTAFIIGGTNLTATYSDAGNTLTLDVDSHTHTESQITDLDHLTLEEVQDDLGTGFIVGGTDITVTYDDGANTLTIDSTATGVTDHGALTGLGDDDHTQYLNNTRHNALDHSTALGTTVLADISDVTETTITSGDVLRWNGSAWVNYADSNFASSSHNHAAGDVNSGTFVNARISQSSVTQHEAALSITESQISDLDHYATSDFNTDFAASNIQSLNNVTITSVTNDEVLAWNGSAWINQTAAEAGLAVDTHNHPAGDITSGTFVDARIAESNVTQHEAALSITESQVSDLDHLTIEEVQDDLGTGFIVGGTDITVTYNDISNTLTIDSTAGGATDHGGLSGLGDDDHTQYLNTSRHNSEDHSTAMSTVVLDDISDVTETTITSGDLLRWNGSAWVNYADSNYATSGHGHTSGNISDFAEAVSDQVGTMVTGNTETGISVTYVDGDNTLDFAVSYGGTPPALTPDIAAAAGTADTASRSDHVHNVPAATAVGISNSSSNAEGNSTSFARANHTHAVTGFATTSHNHAAGDTTSGTFVDARISQSSVTQHEGAIDHGSISGLAGDDHTQYHNDTRHDSHDHSTALGSAVIGDLSGVTITSVASGEILEWSGSAWINRTLAEAGIEATGHSHVEADITNLDHYTSSDFTTDHGGVSGSHVTNGNSHNHAGGDGAQIDHGGLAGTGDDDHTIYSLASGTRSFTGTVSGIEPTADAHLATKKYIDTLVGADTFLLMGA